MRRVETAIRPVTVASRVGGFICNAFLVEPVRRVGAARTACPRFKRKVNCLTGRVCNSAARAQNVPFVTCSTGVGL